MDKSPVHQIWRKQSLQGTVKRGKKTRRTEEEVGKHHHGMDRPGVRQVPEGSGEQRKMEKTGCEVTRGATTTPAVKGYVKINGYYYPKPAVSPSLWEGTDIRHVIITVPDRALIDAVDCFCCSLSISSLRTIISIASENASTGIISFRILPLRLSIFRIARNVFAVVG